MNIKLRRNFIKALIATLFLVMIFFVALIMLALNLISRNVASEIFNYHVDDVNHHIANTIHEETDILNAMLNDVEIRLWIEDENNELLATAAVNRIRTLNQSYGVCKSFVIFEESKHVYLFCDEHFETGYSLLGTIDDLDDSFGFYNKGLIPDNERIHLSEVMGDDMVWVDNYVHSDGEIKGMVGFGVDKNILFDVGFTSSFGIGVDSVLANNKGVVYLWDSKLSAEQREKVNRTFEEHKRTIIHNGRFINNDIATVPIRSEGYDYIATAQLPIGDVYLVSFLTISRMMDSHQVIAFVILMVTIGMLVILAAQQIMYRHYFKAYEDMYESIDKRVECLVKPEDATEDTEVDAIQVACYETMLTSLENMYRHIAIGIVFLNESLEVTYMNPFVGRLLGYENIHEIGRFFDLMINPNDLAYCKLRLRIGMRVELTTKLRTKEGLEHWCLVSIGVGSKVGSLKYAVSIIDSEESVEEKERLQEVANHDELTGIINRRHLNNIIDREIETSKRYGYPLSMAIIDIDFFKEVNDMNGHIIGDVVLRELAKLISENIREADYFGRWGGEEFVVVMPHTDEVRALSAMDKLRKIIAMNSFHNRIIITCSFGVESYMPSETSDTWFERADSALYKAKSFGRNRIETYTSSLSLFDYTRYEKDYLTNISLIDQQHKELFLSIVQLHEFSAAMTPSLIEAFLYDLKQHFMTEEFMMDESNYAKRAEHRLSHKRMVEETSERLMAYKSGMEEINRLIAYLLQDVLLKHLVEEDSLWAKTMNQRK